MIQTDPVLHRALAEMFMVIDAARARIANLETERQELLDALSATESPDESGADQ